MPIEERVRRSVEAYVEAWNEHDAERRAALIAQSCSESLRIVGPNTSLRGRHELDAAIIDFHRRRPGDHGRLTSRIEVHGRVFRFAAVAEGSSAAPPVEMLDAGECDEEGRLALVLSFVGAAPPRR